LAHALEIAGGKLMQRSRWAGDYSAEGVVRASGRQIASGRPPWVGLKVHATGVRLEADLEMHACSGAYVGICRLDKDRVNVCGLFSNSPRSNAEKFSVESLRGFPGTSLHRRLERASFVPGSFCSVSGFSLKPQHACDSQHCCIGDALTMIPPVTGNGMSMALEAAQLAAEPLRRWSAGELSWTEARKLVAQGCDQAFARRLHWARFLQQIMFAPFLHGGLGRAVLASKPIWSLLFAMTR
jgi:menaquinone-9 beta-reductase